MKIFIGADHRGFKLKEFLREWLMKLDYEVVDCGAFELDKDDDYVDFATKVAKSTARDDSLKFKNYGIVICGSGVGVDMVANKIKGIRCGFGLNVKQVKKAREDDDINVLALAADFVEVGVVEKMVRAFLKTKFSGEKRYQRRLKKILKLEDDVG